MATKFQIKRTSVSGRTPNTTNSANSSYIAAGELALNLTDKKMYSSNGTNYFEIGAFKVELVNSTSNVSTFTEISTLQFDEDSGFDVTNPSAGVAKVAMNSTFKFWQVNGTTQLTATGLDTVNFISGDNITITANGANTPQSIAFSTSLTPTFTRITVGNSTVNTVANSTSITTKQIYANGAFGTTGQVLTSNGSGMYWSDKVDSTFTISSETFTANGTATQFTLSQPTTSLETFVFLNGVAQIPTTDYSISNVTLTFVAPPANNDEVEVRIIDIPQINGVDIKLDSFVGNGSNTVYTLSTSLSTNTTTFVYLNGVAQVPTVDYGVSGSTLTFTTAPVNLELIRAVTINPVGNYASDSFTANSTVNNNFTLSIPTVTNRALVFINGVAQAPSIDYYVTGSTLKLTNNAAANDVVQVRSFFDEPSGSGANTTIQYNFSGRLKGSSGFTFNETTNNVTIGNTLIVPNFILNASNPPSNSTSTGLTGTFAWDSSYFYIATGTNTWKKVPISTDGVVGSAVTAGSNTQVQFNDSGALGATAGLTFNKDSNTLSVSNTLSTLNILANGSIGTNGQVLLSNGAGIYWGAGGASGSGVGITRESFTGNGSNTVFTLSTQPIDETHLMVYVDRVIQRDPDYSVSGTTLSFVVAPDNGADIDAYIMTSANQQHRGVKTNVFTGNGTNTQFTLAATSSNSSYTLVYVDSLFQPTSEYTVTGTTLTFNSPPDNGVNIDVIQLGIGLIGDPQVAGANNEIQFNSSNSFGANNKFTFNPSTSTLAIGSNVTVNTSTIFIGNSTVNTTIIAGNINLQGTQLQVGNVIVNGNQLVVGNVTITDTQISVGNSTVNTVLGQTGSLSGNGALLTSVNAIALQGNTVSDILVAANTAANTLASAAFTNAASRADSAYTNAASYADTKAATAYSNAASYADTKASEAFSNAASRADSAYTNAVAYAASNTYVNNTFLPLAGGTLTGALTINATANIVSNLSANNVTFRGDVQIDGNLVVSGTSVTLNVATLAVEDNMIHLNNGSTSTHPDLGVAGNYNDGTYKHAGIFRDATDGVWKVFDGYLPEPNTAFIDTSNASFRIADFTANVVTAASINVVSGASITTIAAGNTTITGFANVIGVSNTDGLRVVRSAGVTSQYIELNTNASAAYVTFNSSASNPKDVYYDIPPANNTSDLFHMFRVSALDKLKVNTSVVTVNAQLSTGNTTITGFINVSTNTATFGTAAYVVANGNVGIGNTTPGEKLVINGTTRMYGSNGVTMALFAHRFADGSQTRTLNVIAPASESSTVPFQLQTGNALEFIVDSSSVLYLSDNYNVGIGNTAPNAKLQVTGTANISGNVALGGDLTVAGTLTVKAISSNGSVGTAGQLLASNGTSTYWINPPASTNVDAQYTWTNTHTFANTITFGNSTVNSTITSTTFKVGGNTSTFGTAAYIVANGNVGVGTATPISKLHVSGSIRTVLTSNAGGDTLLSAIEGVTNGYQINVDTSNNIEYRWNTGTNTRAMTVIANGNVGVATSSPSQKLTVEGGLAVTSSAALPAALGSMVFSYESAVNRCYMGDGTGYSFAFSKRAASTTTDLVTLTDTGNFGVGTTNPTTRFRVSGGRSVFAANSEFYSIAVQHNSGGVGQFYIGATNAVSPDMLISQTGGTEVLRIGDNGGLSLNTPVTYNNNFFINGYATMARMYSGADAVFGHNVYGDPNSRVLKQVNSNYYASWIRMYYNKGIHFGTSNVVGTAGDTVSDPAGTTNDKMVLDIDGRLMLNTTTANTTANTILTVKGFTSNTSNFMIEGRDSNGVLRTAITDRGAQNWYIQAGDGLEKGSIRYSTPGGFVGILYFDSAGTSRSDFRHVANGGFTWHAHALGTVPPELMRLDNAGNLTIVGTLTESSSITLKENLDPIQDALGAITSLTGYVYDRKDGTAKRRAGLIAEEVESILPNVVKKDSDGNPTGIQYTNLIAYLVESIKELKAEIDILKGR